MFACLAHQSSMQELDLLNPQLDPRITFTRASSKTYFGSDGLMHTAAADEWPLEYDPITLKPIGRSVWEQRTNLLKDSVGVGVGVNWIRGSGTTATPGFSDPMGGANASKVVLANGSGGGVSQNPSVSSGTTYTASIYAAPSGFDWIAVLVGLITGTRVAWFNINTGAIGTVQPGLIARIEMAPGGSYRCQVTATADNSSGQARYIPVPSNGATTGDGVNGAVLFGAQLEAGAFASPYIPTAGSQVTRVAEMVSLAPIGVRYNNAEGTLLVDGAATGGICVFLYAGAASGATNNLDIIRANASVMARSFVGGGQQAGLSVALDNGARAKMAFGYKKDAFGFAVTGKAFQTDSMGDIPSADVLRIGSNGVGFFQNGVANRIRIYPGRLANSELQALTA